MVDIKELLAYKLQLHGGNELIKSLSANWAQYPTKSQFTEIRIEIDNFSNFPPVDTRSRGSKPVVREEDVSPLKAGA